MMKYYNSSIMTGDIWEHANSSVSTQNYQKQSNNNIIGHFVYYLSRHTANFVCEMEK